MYRHTHTHTNKFCYIQQFKLLYVAVSVIRLQVSAFPRQTACCDSLCMCTNKSTKTSCPKNLVLLLLLRHVLSGPLRKLVRTYLAGAHDSVLQLIQELRLHITPHCLSRCAGDLWQSSSQASGLYCSMTPHLPASCRPRPTVLQAWPVEACRAAACVLPEARPAKLL